jgi:molybdopterin-guanine dinucleotide biosynthesis protein A
MQSAVVIAGGQSTRFEEGDKAVADLAGRPMIRRVADRLEPVVSTLVVNCRADQRGAIAAALEGYSHEVRFAIDPDPNAGPMAGIGTGLRAVTDEYAVVVACDMPLVDRDLVEHLFDTAEGHDAAVPRVEEWFQTTQAVYRAEAMAEACDRALARGDSKVLAPLSELDWVVVDEDTLRRAGWLESFKNVNTVEELRSVARRLRSDA